MIWTKIYDLNWQSQIRSPQNQNSTNFVNKKLVIFFIAILFCNVLLNFLTKSTHPLQINEFPYNLIVALRQILLPNLFFTFYASLLISKSPFLLTKIRKALKLKTVPDVKP